MLDSFNYVVLLIFIKIILVILLIDNLLKIILRENTRFFLLHTLFNIWITYVVFKDSIKCILFPLNILDNDYEFSAIESTTGIAAFHIYHMFAYSDLTLEDWLHHLISSIFVAGLGVYLPFGKIPSLANLVMCGFPGGVDYFMLFLVKLGLLDKMTEKLVNRYLNLIIRWPIMFLSSYFLILNIYHQNTNNNYVIFMLIGMLLHCSNAIYYCDKVIGNYYLRKNHK
jgi:hypothetical protein